MFIFLFWMFQPVKWNEKQVEKYKKLNKMCAIILKYLLYHFMF